MKPAQDNSSHPLLRLWMIVSLISGIVGSLNVVSHIADLQSLSTSLKWLLAWWNYITFTLFGWTGLRLTVVQRDIIVITAMTLTATNIWFFMHTGMTAIKITLTFARGQAEKLFHLDAIYDGEWAFLFSAIILMALPFLTWFASGSILTTAIACYPALSVAMHATNDDIDWRPADITIIRILATPGVWFGISIMLALKAWRYVFASAGLVLIIISANMLLARFDPFLDRAAALPVPPAYPEEN